MALSRIRVENYKSIKCCDIALNDLNALIGANGTGKTNLIEAINYFYLNLTQNHLDDNIFDINNKFSNQVSITLTFDLSNFILVSETHTSTISFLFEDESEHSRFGKYYDSILELAKNSSSNTISIKMLQTKGKGIVWSESYENRFIIKSLFPIFYVDVRTLDITEWSQIWSVLGDFGKLSNSSRTEVAQKVQDLLETTPDLKNKISSVKTIFRESELSVKAFASKEYSEKLLEIYLQGHVIQKKGRGLNYYSSGTNSVKYIELLLRAINEISKRKLKEPIVILDEPEISLHPNFVDELSEAFLLVGSKVRILLATHSSRLVKKIITGNDKLFLFRVFYDKNYSYISPMSRFTQYSPTSKYRVLDDHINSYFSKKILFVEGETELELFSNPYIRIIFPKLKHVDVFQAMSQTPILNIMLPSKTKNKIPYLCLIDLDKAISYDENKYCFTLKKEFFGKTKEALMYRGKKEKTQYLKHQRIRIESMTEKLHVHHYLPFYSCKDNGFSEYKNAIHNYLLSYNVFTVNTTIEGALVNDKSFDLAMNYIKNQISEKHFNSLSTYMSTLLSNDKVNLLRIAFNGKSDLLKDRSQVLGNMGSNKAILENASIGKKTSGWVSEFLDSFFENQIPQQYEKTKSGFLKYLQEDEFAEGKIIKEFKYTFFELYEIFSLICDIIK